MSEFNSLIEDNKKHRKTALTVVFGFLGILIVIASIVYMFIYRQPQPVPQQEQYAPQQEQPKKDTISKPIFNLSL